VPHDEDGERARLAARLRTLARLNQLISSSLDVRKVLTEIASAAAELMDAGLVSIWIADEPSRTLRRVAFSNEPLGLDHPAETLGFGEGGVGWVAANRAPLIVADIRVEPRFVAHPWFEAQGFRSALEMPIVFGDSLVGVLALFGTEPFRLAPETEEILDTFAAQAGQAIRNAQQFEDAERRRHQAESANRAKDEFLAVLSHELRTPLTPILGWLRMLQRRSLDEASVQRGLATIERNVKLQLQLIEDLLDVSRIVTGKLSLEARPVNLVAVTDAALEAVRSTADLAGVTVTRTVDPGVGPVWGDAARLQQVASNLLSNALKFTPRGGRVDVALAPAGQGVRLTVQDTGAGIAPEFMPHLFERFRQADTGITRAHGGLGLGLSIVRHIVEAHRGEVRADSPGRGRGSTFTVTLPAGHPSRAVRPLAEPAEPARAAGESPSLDGIRVLLIEDDADSRELFAALLAERGARVTPAASMAEALEALATAVFDLMIADISLPGEDGYALIRAVRARWSARDLPAAAITAYARAEDRARALAAGYQLHVVKPVEPVQLARVVAALRDRHRGAAP
jgi:signal transduction histidine kinase/ActR/RegA family two-component response regulator